MEGDGGDHGRVFERAWISPLIPDSLREGLADVAGEILRLPQDSPLEAPQAGDLVVLMADEPGAFVFSLRLKEPGGKRVHVAMVTGGVDAERAASVARFCMADAIVDASEAEHDMRAALEEIRRIGQRRGPVDSIDVLLARLEERMEGGARELAERVARGLSDERERSFVESVTDADTGLFAGPFMAYKLEEEFKRSWRFRTQLAVVLFDLPATSTLEGSERARVFGEVAGVFLNESRDIDVLGRYDDTSFLMLLPHTGPSGAKVLASRILASLSRIEASTPLETAVAIVAVPSVGVERKDELLDLARMTLVEAWASAGDERIRVAT